MEGTLVEVIEKYQGKTLSANLPYKTQFMIPKDDGKEMKLIVHLVRESAVPVMPLRIWYLSHCCHAQANLHGSTVLDLQPGYGMTLKRCSL